MSILNKCRACVSESDTASLCDVCFINYLSRTYNELIESMGLDRVLWDTLQSQGSVNIAPIDSTLI